MLAEARGNPLAIAELVKAVAASGRHDLDAGPLPTTRRIERVFMDQLDAVPEQSRHVLALISASEGMSAAELVDAAHRVGLPEAHLDPLERAGLITFSDNTIHVRHPLIRSVAYRAAPLSRRSSFHRALADVAVDPTRAAWQRAAAALGPD